MSVEYRTITTKIDVASSTENAVAVTPPPERRKWPSHVIWIGKSLIHGGDLLKIERRIAECRGGFEQTFRVAEWLAEKEGWA